MITKTPGWSTQDGESFLELKDAKEHAIAILFGEENITPIGIVEKESEILDILTTGPGSRPKARAIHGGRKPRKAKGEPTVETGMPTPTTETAN